MSQPQNKTVFEPAPSPVRFAIWFGLLIAATMAIFVNYAVVTTLLGTFGGGEVAGIGINTVAAVVLVAMELFAGAFLLDARGVTTMVPVIRAMPARARRKLGISFTVQLFLFAAIQAGLVWLAVALAGSAVNIPLLSPVNRLPVMIHMSLAFALPFLLMLAPFSADRLMRILRRRAT